MADFTSLSNLNKKVKEALDAYPSLLVETSPYVQLGLEDNVRAYYQELITLEEKAVAIGYTAVSMPSPVGIGSSARADLAKLI
tara:strand:- start:197 stop:445 length:249 start_codon:yes stop_codon:yes gene_type:complete